MATLQWTDGKLYDVPDDKVQQALSDGFVPAPEARVAASEQPLAAAGEALVRGVTMGFGDPLLVNIEAEASLPANATAEQRLAARKAAAEKMRLRQEENPVVATVGEIGGAVGSVLAGPAAVVAKGAGAIRAAGGLAARAVAGAAEGSLWGLGSVVSEAALEDTELTAEKVAAGVAAGALTGGALDVAAYGVGKGVSAAVRRFGGRGVKDTLEDLAFQAEKRQLLESSGQAEARLIRRGGNMEDVIRIGREEGVLDATAGMNEATANKAKDALTRLGNETEQIVSSLDSVKPLSRDTTRFQLVADMERRLQASFQDRYAAKDAVESFIKENLVPVLEDTKASWPKLMSLQQDIRKAVANKTGVEAEVYNAGRKLIRNTVFSEAQTLPLAPGISKKLMENQKRYAALSFLEEVISARGRRLEATGGPLSLGLGGMLSAGAGASVAGIPGAVASAAAMRAYRERGGFLIGGALRALANSNATTGIGKSLMKRVKVVLSTAPELLGAFRAPLESASARGADDLLETHIQLASSPQGEEYLSTLGMEPESPEQVNAVGLKLSYIAAAQNAADAYDQTLAQATDGMLGAARGRPLSSKPPTTTLKDYNNFQKSLQKLLRDPEGAYAQVPAEMQGAIPQVSGLTAATILRGAKFLDSKAPKSPYEGMPEAVAPQWQPSQVELDRFNRYREAVENPAKALQNMANGYLSPEQVEAMKAVYPRLYSDLQQKLAERLASLKKPLNYQQKLSLSLIMGPTALAMNPQQVQVLQQVQASAGPQSGAMRKPDGRQTVNAQKNLETQGQRMEAR